jgi:hypothetical protein
MVDAVPTPPAPPPPKPPAPLPRLATVRQWTPIVMILVSAAIGIGAAFGFDVCGALASAGVHFDACSVLPAVSP